MALEKSAKHNEQNKLSMGLAAVVVGILIVVIMVACFGLYQRLVKNRERISELQSEIVKEEQRAEDIEEYRKYTETREYIEEVAREKLGLVYEGEVIFKEASSD
jgi:cell division protein FtsB